MLDNCFCKYFGCQKIMTNYSRDVSFNLIVFLLSSLHIMSRSRRGRDRRVVEFTITCTISAYHH
jgi:hypothetical protein